MKAPNGARLEANAPCTAELAGTASSVSGGSARMFLLALHAEILKTQWLLLGCLVVVGPFLAALFGIGGEEWIDAYVTAAIQYSWLFYPLLAGVFAALVCRVEHADGGWKQTLALPVARGAVYLAKYVLIAGLLAISTVVFGLVFIGMGLLSGFGTAIPWQTLGQSLAGGWVAVLPLAAVQLWVSSRWKSFGAALALNVCLTLPAIFAAQSAAIGPWYPWAQPMLAMATDAFVISTINTEAFWIVVAAVLCFALIGGLATFGRADASN